MPVKASERCVSEHPGAPWRLEKPATRKSVLPRPGHNFVHWAYRAPNLCIMSESTFHYRPTLSLEDEAGIINIDTQAMSKVYIQTYMGARMLHGIVQGYMTGCLSDRRQAPNAPPVPNPAPHIFKIELL